MDFSFFVEFGDKDVLPDGPHLSITVRAAIALTLTLPYPIRFTIRRLAKGDGTDARPCVFRWNPTADAFGRSGFVVLRHRFFRGVGSLEPISVDHDDESQAATADGSQSLWELGPGGEITVTATLPESYYRTIAKAQDFGVYTLLFPGAQIGLWNWGSVEEHSRQDMTKENLRVNGKLILPGGARISFDTLSCAGERPWPDRVAYEAKHGFERANEANKKWHVQEAQKKPRFPALQPPPPIEPTDRVPGAPHFTVAVKGPMTVKSYEKLEVTLRFTYHGVTRTDGEPEETGARPVTLRSWALTGSQEFSVQLRRLRSGSDGDWEDCEFDEEFQCGWYPYDDGDVEVVIGQQGDDFTSLQPGKSWETTELLNDPSDVIHLPRDSVPGDMFRYRVTRSEVDWWDWGSMEDHKETALKMFMWYRGSLTDPKDNGGRPKVLVPASDWFGFTLIE